MIFNEKDIAELKGYCKRAWQKPMEVASNIPFNCVVNKPRPSMSKHDERPNYWNYDDGVFIAAFQPPTVMALLEEIERLRGLVEEKQIQGQLGQR